MVSTEQKTFHCELIGPTGKLLDCQTTSVVFPAHDGQVGILFDHMPMLSQLGLGIMKVAQPPAKSDETASSSPDLEFFIDGGFALVAENSVTVIAYSVLALQGITSEAVESLLEKTAKNLASPGLSPAQRMHENERMRTLRSIKDSLTS
ncbi:MAG TPA: F0F1 ATP synthase subunit epsilon [Sedimentisphaerales bacterium]|nr:F0F1 ATP synthase subunit epsilon [Sedimentisphaerales bacterium]HQG47852.1 F0F1 ATP synthase subunit epsilon [Sedimentisphaerales bacterium]